jgi:hypothetical protein
MMDLLKCKQPVTVIFILSVPRFNLSRESNGNVIAEGIETVEDVNNALLLRDS